MSSISAQGVFAHSARSEIISLDLNRIMPA